MPQLSTKEMLKRVYPARVMVGKEGQTAVDGALKVINNLAKSLFSQNMWIGPYIETADGGLSIPSHQ